MADSIYLSGHDIYRLAHYAHWIPGTRGLIQPFMAASFPTWSFNALYGAVARSGLITKRPHEFSRRHLPPGIIGVEVHRSGTVTPDDGSSTRPARTASWVRDDGRRISEHLMVRTPFPGRTIVHLPHSSRLIPAAERPKLCLSNAALHRELTASTDAWVDRVAADLGSLRHDITIAAATLSRLVIDPERFPHDDPAERFGRGVVYTTTATGRTLRAPLTAAERADYLGHHKLYTQSIEYLVDGAIGAHGHVTIVDLHSYPVTPQHFEDPHAHRPEVCIGVDEHHTPDVLVRAAMDAFSTEFDTEINTPYAGAYVPGRHYRSNSPATSVMIEIRRDMLRTRPQRQQTARAIDRMLTAVSRREPAARAR